MQILPSVIGNIGTVTVQRRLPDGGLEDIAYSVPFAFRAFSPDAQIRHVQ